jgi:hypothetical protein
MTLNWKVISATSLTVVILGVGAYILTVKTPMQEVANNSVITEQQQQILDEEVTADKYSPEVVLAIQDTNDVVDSLIDEAIDEQIALEEEESDIYLADAEAQAISDLEKLYDAYEL